MSAHGANAEQCQHGSSAPRDTLEDLPKSQAGAGRQKCTVCAFRLGARWQSERMLDALVSAGHVDLARDLATRFHV